MLTAERLLHESDSALDLATLTMTMDVAEAYRNAGRNADAAERFAAAYAQMTALGATRPNRPARC